MKKLNVIYAGWGERFKLGVLADDGKDIVFEYTPEALKRKLQFSPFKMALSDQSFGNLPQHQLRLPGFISDALPDGWGMLLMDRLFRRQGRNPASVSPLDRLRLVGENAMGALAFEPAETEELLLEDLQLLDIARDVYQVFEENESESVLRNLMLMGGSPHGVRPKVAVEIDAKANRISKAGSNCGTPLLVKFPAQNENKEACAIEALYCRLARISGLRVPEFYYFDLSKRASAFGTVRFDRAGNMRVPMHTAAGAAHVDFRIPQFDYTALLRLTRLMTNDLREVHRAFENCVFNVVFNNRDDHSKNFSFLMDKDGQWTLSPAYDLTFSAGPHGEHQMDICGEARAPGFRELMELASKTGIKPKVAEQTIERIVAVSYSLRESIDALPIREQTLKVIEKAVATNRERMIRK